MEKAVAFRTIMNRPYRDHPSEESLERFLFNQSEEVELEIVESHIMACDACVTRLEKLELNIKATKMALAQLEAERVVQPAKTRLFSWLAFPKISLPQLSVLGASVAACAVAFTFLSLPRDVELVANRDNEVQMVALWRPLEMHIDAKGIPSGAVSVQVVDARGTLVWHAPATSVNDQINVRIPALTAAARQYFVRVYSNPGVSVSSMLREYSIQTKSLF